MKEISFLSLCPTDCKIISTFTFFFANTLKILNAIPGVSSIPITAILAASSSPATPLISLSLDFTLSFTTVPSSVVRLDLTTKATPCFLASSTERL